MELVLECLGTGTVRLKYGRETEEDGKTEMSESGKKYSRHEKKKFNGPTIARSYHPNRLPLPEAVDELPYTNPSFT